MKFEPIQKNRKRRAVLVQVVGNEHHKIHQLTRDAQKAYAEKIGADYKVLKPKSPITAHSKACAFHYTRYYDQCLILDVDVVPTGLASNIFDLVPMGHWGVVDEAHMRPRENWHSHQDDLNQVLDRKDLEAVYLSRLANTGVIVAPHNAEAIFYNEEREPCQNNREEKAWFTYNLERARQKVVWLHELWNVCCTDPDFNKKYAYANFIHRNEDPHKYRSLASDITQHQGSVNIPDYEPGGNAIITVDFSHDPFYRSTRDSIVKYAKKCGAQLIEISGTYSLRMHKCWPKYYAGVVAQDFDKTLYLDTDVYVDEEAPNIFDRVPDNQWCFIDESGLIGNQALTVEYEKCIANHGLVRRGRWQIFNAGIMVIPPHGIDIYHHSKPWQLDQFWDEQTLLNHDIVGHEFHVMDTSWDTMPFTRSNEPIKFFHAAGGGKFQNLSAFLDHEFNRCLFFWPSKSIFAERLSRNLDSQLYSNIMIGHFNYDDKEATEECKKYITIVDDPVDFKPHLVFYIQTPVAHKMPHKPGVYIVTPQDLKDNESIQNLKMWSRIVPVIATDMAMIKKTEDLGIGTIGQPLPYNVAVPPKNGTAYNDIDKDCFLVGLIYSPGEQFKTIAETIKNERGFKTITIDDYTKSVPCSHRLNNLRNSGNIIARMDAVIDITDQNPYNPLLLEAVLSRTPVAALGMDLEIYEKPDVEDIMDTLRRLKETHLDHLEHRRQVLTKYLDYHDCWERWRSFMEQVEVKVESELTI